jgi:hypothetical protein
MRRGLSRVEPIRPRPCSGRKKAWGVFLGSLYAYLIHFRLGKSAYGMRQWEKAIQHYESILKEFPSEASITEPELRRAKARLKEATTGIYDLQSLYNESKTPDGQVKMLDIADYTGPVRVERIRGKGKQGCWHT